MKEFKNIGSMGWYRDGNNLITFQLGESMPLSQTGTIDMQIFTTALYPLILNIKDNYVLIKGTNNKLPEEIEQTIGGNRILPELIEKQTRMLYGKGPRIYSESFNNGKLVRNWEKNNIIESWIDSWQDKGLQDNIKDFCEKVIHDVYYYEDYWVKWRFNKSILLNLPGTGELYPIGGLEHIENKRCRLTTKKNLIEAGLDYVDADFDTIIVGNWQTAMEKQFSIYNRLRPHNILTNYLGVSYHKNPTVGQIYGYNKFYAGIKDWLIGTNRNPKYINSYLANSLNAKVHVIVPNEWVTSVEQKLEEYVKKNQELQDAGKDLLKPNGVEIGTEYHVGLRDAYIAKEFEKLSSFLSGVENQGKLYATYSYMTSDGEVSWKIQPLDLKYREFITALIDYDKRADEVITMARGIDPSISSISKDGVISKSGADLYYNYVIYLHNLTLAEEITTEAINWAIKINFPELYRGGLRLGFYNEAPARQEDITPGDRLQNTLNNAMTTVKNALEAQNRAIDELKNMITHGN